MEPVEVPNETTEEEGQDVEPETEEEVEESIDESANEDAEEPETEVDDTPLEDSLEGVFSKSHIEVLNKIGDEALRDSLIEEGKKSRQDLDRKRLELGESKKAIEAFEKAAEANNLNLSRQQYADVFKNYAEFEALVKNNPTEAVKALAKSKGVDLNGLTEKPAVPTEDVEDDYLTDEELKTRNEIQTLREELSSLKNKQKLSEEDAARQELNDFVNAQDAEGKIKHPHFDKVREDMHLLFNKGDASMTLEKAYKKAVLMNDELVELREKELISKVEKDKIKKIEKAKKLKKQATLSSKVSATANDFRSRMSRDFDKMGIS